MGNFLGVAVWIPLASCATRNDQPGQRIDGEVLRGGHLELHAGRATGRIGSFIGLLADHRSLQGSLAELNGAAAAGWAGLPGAAPNP